MPSSESWKQARAGRAPTRTSGSARCSDGQQAFAGSRGSACTPPSQSWGSSQDWFSSGRGHGSSSRLMSKRRRSPETGGSPESSIRSTFGTPSRALTIRGEAQWHSYCRRGRPLCDLCRESRIGPCSRAFRSLPSSFCSSPSWATGCGVSGVNEFDDLGPRIVDALGEPAAHELLDVLTRSDADRAALIGRLHQREDAAWLAELLIDIESDPDDITRLQVIEALRRAF